MAFDPDKYLAEKTNEFNADSYLQAKTGEVPSSYSALQSALMGGVNQLNVAPVVGAAVQHPIEAFQAAMRPLARLAGAQEAGPEATKDFDASRASLNDNFNAAKSANPKSYIAGNVAGGLALSPILPEVAPGILGGAKLGAGLGALSGAGQALSSGSGVGGIAGEAALGGATGGLLGGAIGGITNALRPTTLDKTAATQALQAASPSKSAVRSILNAAGYDEDTIQDAGNQLIQPSKWLASGKAVVQASDSKEQLLDNLKEAMKSSGQYIGGVADEADQTGIKAVNTDNATDFIKKIMSEKYLTPADRAKNIDFDDVVPLNTFEGPYNDLNKVYQDIKTLGGTGGDITFANAKEILSVIDEAAYKENGDKVDPVLNQLRGIFNNDIENGLKQVSTQSDNPDLYNKFIDAKKMYQIGKLVLKSAQGAVAGDISNRDLGLTDYLAGGIGNAMGGSPAGIAMAGLNYGVRNYGNGIAAKAAQGLAQGQRTITTAVGTGISKGMNVIQQQSAPVVGKILSQATPEALSDWAEQAATSASPVVQQIGKVFKDAAGRDQIGRNALIFTLLQNPTYRDILHSVAASGNQK